MKYKTRKGTVHKSPDRIPIGVSWKGVHDAMREENIRSLQEREGLSREERAGQKKLTIRLPADLHRELKITAAKEDKTLSGLIIERLKGTLKT